MKFKKLNLFLSMKTKQTLTLSNNNQQLNVIL